MSLVSQAVISSDEMCYKEVQMDKIPEIRLIFSLTKKDNTDFDRNDVTLRLGITPSRSSAPTLGKGKLISDGDIYEIENELSGISILPASSPPYQMLMHAHWDIEFPKIECFELEKPLQQLEELLSGKGPEILQVCNEYDLTADLMVRVFAEANNIPVLALSHSSISFWASMGVSIGFDFYLDQEH